MSDPKIIYEVERIIAREARLGKGTITEKAKRVKLELYEIEDARWFVGLFSMKHIEDFIKREEIMEKCEAFAGYSEEKQMLEELEKINKTIEENIQRVLERIVLNREQREALMFTGLFICTLDSNSNN